MESKQQAPQESTAKELGFPVYTAVVGLNVTLQQEIAQRSPHVLDGL